MKFILLLAVTLLSTSAFAAKNCEGVQDSSGLEGKLSEINSEAMTISYKDPFNKQVKCVFSLDENYTPRTANPKKNKYIVDRHASSNCEAKVVWASKSLQTKQEGYVDVEYPCVGGGGCAHGEPGTTESFYCKL